MFGANYFGSIYFGQAYPSLTVGIPVWVSPPNHTANQLPTDQLVFLIPQAQANLHFNLQLDTSSSFASGNLRDISSLSSQTGWEYNNGSSWVAIPLAGVDPLYAGNQARYTPQTPLTSGLTWYRRIRGRVQV